MLKLICFAALVTFACTSNGPTSVDRKHPDAKVFHDAPPPTADAALGTSPGVVSCFASGSPNNACILAVNFCCFDNFVVPHNGFCTTSCAHSDEHCDGSEDCSSGQTCYADAWHDADNAIHWTMACSVSPVMPSDRIMCHPGDGTCPVGTTCTQANPTAMIYDFPTTLYVCN